MIICSSVVEMSFFRQCASTGAVIALVTVVIGSMLFLQTGYAETAATNEPVAIEPIPYRNEDILNKDSIQRLLIGVGFALVFIPIIALLFKRFFVGNKNVFKGGGDIKVLESRKINQKTLLTIVEIYGERHVIVDNGESLIQLTPNGKNWGKENG